MSDLSDDIRARRAAIDTLPEAERPAALAALADAVEAEDLPGVARSLRLIACAQAEALGDTALAETLRSRTETSRLRQRPCPLDRPVAPDRTAWRDRMKALADRRPRRRPR